MILKVKYNFIIFYENKHFATCNIKSDVAISLSNRFHPRFAVLFTTLAVAHRRRRPLPCSAAPMLPRFRSLGLPPLSEILKGVSCSVSPSRWISSGKSAPFSLPCLPLFPGSPALVGFPARWASEMAGGRMRDVGRCMISL